MKKTTLILLAFIPLFLNAQINIKLSADVGRNFYYFINHEKNFEDFHTINNSFNYSVGCSLEKKVSKLSSFETGLYVDFKSNDVTFKDVFNDNKIEFVYTRNVSRIHIPLLYKKNLKKNLGFSVGVTGKFLISETKNPYYVSRFFNMDINAGIYSKITKNIELGIFYSHSAYSIFKVNEFMPTKLYYLTHSVTLSVSYKLFNIGK